MGVDCGATSVGAELHESVAPLSPSPNLGFGGTEAAGHVITHSKDSN